INIPFSQKTLAVAGDVVAMGGRDGVVDIFSAREPEFGKSWFPLKARDVIVQAVAVSPDGATVAAGEPDGTNRFGDGGSRQVRGGLTGHIGVVFGLAFSPDGRTLVSGSADKTVRTWDVAAACEKHTFAWHSAAVTCVKYSPDGLTIAAAGYDQTIVV